MVFEFLVISAIASSTSFSPSVERFPAWISEASPAIATLLPASGRSLVVVADYSGFLKSS